MKIFHTIFTAILITLVMGCATQHLKNPYQQMTKDQLSALSEKKYGELLDFASPIACTDPNDWKIANIKSLCYDTGHIAYHRSVNEKKLRSLIKDYDLLMDIYAPMIRPMIKCAPYKTPKGVSCMDGKAEIAY